MARPRKLGTSEMLQIVDSYYESNGNPYMLKYSFFEEYAVSLGLDVKAYDFRRNEAVRKHVDELRGMGNFDSIQAIAYKGIDVDAFFKRNRTRESLRSGLLELDETWRRIYDRASTLSLQNKELLKEVFAAKQEYERLARLQSELDTAYKSAKQASNAFMLENRYLKRMLKQYLYPAIANAILINEHVLEQANTEATLTAMADLVDSAVPSPFSQAIAADSALLSRETSLLQHMKNQIQGSNADA